MQQTDFTWLNRFRLVAVLEGVSYIVLLLFMPLKYFANMPAGVKYTGWAHGVLFMAYVVLLLIVWVKYKWSFGKVFLAFLASLVPFGTFILDRKLKNEMAAQQ